MQRTRFVLTFLLVMIVAVVAATQLASAADKTAKQPQSIKASKKLRQAVSPSGILVHERRFQRIADANGGTRASGTPGYDASADYVAGKLDAAGYDVTRQEFEFDLFAEDTPSELEQTSPDPTSYVNGEALAIMEYSGNGDVTAPVEVVDTDVEPTDASTSGCEPTDFDGFTSGNIALVQRGTCPFADKAENAENAGAVAVLIFNRGTTGEDGVLNGTLGEDSDVGIPVLGLDFATGADLADPAGTEARVFTDASVETTETSNVIADSPKGRSDRTVVVGAHLDSVLEGPGINDNGSGTSTILEIALQMPKVEKKPANKVRFAFWGAEESGLIGSDYYVNDLAENDPEALDDIALNLNFDMVGSPNFVRFVYDGNGSATPDDPDDSGPAGSAEIERTFNSYFAARDLRTEPTAFDGRSDYGPFIAVGIPAGGLFSGAEGIKTPDEAEIYGGAAGEPYDPCYHLACDDISNLSITALDQLSDGAAHATQTYAKTKDLFVDDGAGARRALGNPYDEYKGPLARK